MAKDSLTIAWHKIQKRKFAEAIKLLESRSIREIYRGNLEYNIMLGTACLYLGDIGSAITYFDIARRETTKDARLLLGQAAIFLRRGDTNRAVEYYLEICEDDPNNKTAKLALDFIRIHGDYDTICRWIDTGRIEQFYPPLGNKAGLITVVGIPVLACILGCILAFAIFAKHNSKDIYNGKRADLSSIMLTEDEKNSAKEKDLTSQTYLYIFSDKEIAKIYQNALSYFQEKRDNAAQIEINRLLNSDAALSIKQKAQVLNSYLAIPDFDTITDVPKFADVVSNPNLYMDCWVDWGGKISNAQIYEDGSYSCDLLIGDETLSHYEGTVTVKFDKVPNIIGSQGAKILGKISISDKTIYLKARSVYQSIY